MLSHSDLKKGVRIILENQPYEVLEARPIKKARGLAVIQTKIRNLITGSLFSRNFHQDSTFQEAEIEKFNAKFLYSHRGKFFFSKEKDPSQRFDLTENQITSGSQFLKPGQNVEGLIFNGKVINVSLPIKINLKVTEAPPGVKGNRSQAGTKNVILETGAKINTPLFIEKGATIEVNTESGEYVRRVE